MHARSKSIIFASVLFFQFIYCTKPILASILVPIPKILAEKKFSWIVPNVIAGMAMPTSNDQIEALHDLSIGLVVTLTEPKEGPDPNIFNRVEIERLILPTHDNRCSNDRAG
jgi:hypothetical protein